LHFLCFYKPVPRVFRLLVYLEALRFKTAEKNFKIKKIQSFLLLKIKNITFIE